MGDRSDQEEKRGNQSRENNLACDQFLSVLHSPEHPKRFTELDGEEKREEGDRGDQEKKKGTQKGREQYSQ